MATLKDVAKLAGVSPITVSRVINDPDSVKDSTKLRVQDAMDQLRYTPNTAAKNLASNRSGVVDVYIPEDVELSNPFFMYLIAGVSKVLSEHMYSFLLVRNWKREHLCDGYIASGLLKNEIIDFEQYASARNRPVVLFGHTDLPDVDCIDVDNVLGSRRAVEHLLSLGHRDIAMINIAEDKDYTVDRLNGYRQALEEAGIAFDPDRVVYSANSVAGGISAVNELLRRKSFTAVFCATDTVAIGAVSELQRLGHGVPEDISVVGFDGVGHQHLVTPNLTSIQQPVYQIGEALARTLLARLEGEELRQKRLVEPALMLGRSTAPCMPRKNGNI